METCKKMRYDTINNDKQYDIAIKVSNQLFEEGRYEKAIEIYKKIFYYIISTNDLVKYEKRIQKIFFNLFQALICMKKYQDAIKMFPLTIQVYYTINNDVYLLIAWYGECLFRVRDYDNALEQFLIATTNIDKIRDRNTRNNTRLLFGFLLMILERKEDAIEIIDQCEKNEEFKELDNLSFKEIKEMFIRVDFKNEKTKKEFQYILNNFLGESS